MFTTMEKKEYIKPTFAFINADTDAILQSSTPKYSPEKSFDEEESVGAREFESIWDDEDLF